MKTGSKVFLISPLNVLAYLFKSPSGEELIYNAGSLERLDRSLVQGFTKVKGKVTDRFGVRPTVLAYSNGKLEVIYAPTGSKDILRSNGSLAKSRKVVARADILVPDFSKSSLTEKLAELPLAEANEESLKEFISSPHESLEERVKRLEEVVEAMNRRLYRIYPVNCPNTFALKGKEVPVVPIEEINEKIAKGEVERIDLEPNFQPFAGSHRSENRLWTFHTSAGETYLAHAKYDSETNKLNPPK